MEGLPHATEARIAHLEERVAHLERTNSDLQNSVNKVLMSMLTGDKPWGSTAPPPPPPPQGQLPPPALPGTTPHQVVPSPAVGIKTGPLPTPTQPEPFLQNTDAPQAPPPRRDRPAPGQSLQRIISRTPSRPPEARKGPVVPSFHAHLQKERKKPLPVDKRRHPHTQGVAATLKRKLSERDDTSTPEGKIPALWKPPANVWSRYVATFVPEVDAVDETEPQEKVQHLGEHTDVAQCRAHMSGYIGYTGLCRVDVNLIPAQALSAIVRGLHRLPDYNLEQVRASIEAHQRERSITQSQSQDGEVGPQYSILTCLHSVLMKLVWHSAEATGDVLEVILRVLQLLKGSDTAGQAEMLQASSRLCDVNPSEYKVMHEERVVWGCPLRSLPFFNSTHAVHVLSTLDLGSVDCG